MGLHLSPEAGAEYRVREEQLKASKEALDALGRGGVGLVYRRFEWCERSIGISEGNQIDGHGRDQKGRAAAEHNGNLTAGQRTHVYRSGDRKSTRLNSSH